MGDRKPLQPGRRARARHSFSNSAQNMSGPSVGRQDIIVPSRYRTLMDHARLDADQMIARMDLHGYIAQMCWTAFLPRPTPRQLMDNLLKNEWQPDGEFVYRFVRAAHRTPDALVFRQDRRPARPEITEAIVMFIRNARGQPVHGAENMIDFVNDEITKAGRLGALRTFDGILSNHSMMKIIEEAYKTYAKPLHDDKAFTNGTPVSPQAMIGRQIDMISFYAGYLDQQVVKGVETLSMFYRFQDWRNDMTTHDYIEARANAHSLRAHIHALGREITLPSMAVKP